MGEECKKKTKMHHIERKLHYECARFAKVVSKLAILYKQLKCELIEKTSLCARDGRCQKIFVSNSCMTPG